MLHIEVGYDCAKKIKGRKRHVLVDTLGLLIVVVVTAANLPERAGAKLVFAQVKREQTKFWRLIKIWVDGGYRGEGFMKWVMDTRCGELCAFLDGFSKLSYVQSNTKDLSACKDLKFYLDAGSLSGLLVGAAHSRSSSRQRTTSEASPHAWCRRFNKDYEVLPVTSETMIRVAMIRLMLRRLA